MKALLELDRQEGGRLPLCGTELAPLLVLPRLFAFSSACRTLLLLPRFHSFPTVLSVLVEAQDRGSECQQLRLEGFLSWLPNFSLVRQEVKKHCLYALIQKLFMLLRLRVCSHISLHLISTRNPR